MKICTLAALLAVADTAWADQTAYFTARYGGWSKEPSCSRSGEGKVCWTLTIGKSQFNQETSQLSYTCWSNGEGTLAFGFETHVVVGGDEDQTLAVRWDSSHEEHLAVWVQTGERRGKPTYWFHVVDPLAFFRRAENHARITVTLPVKDHQGRRVKDKYPLRNISRSIETTMRECGITEAFAGEESG